MKWTLVILGLKLIGMKKANKGCLHVKNPIGEVSVSAREFIEFLYLPLDREEKPEL